MNLYKDMALSSGNTELGNSIQCAIKTLSKPTRYMKKYLKTKGK